MNQITLVTRAPCVKNLQKQDSNLYCKNAIIQFVAPESSLQIYIYKQKEYNHSELEVFPLTPTKKIEIMPDSSGYLYTIKIEGNKDVNAKIGTSKLTSKSGMLDITQKTYSYLFQVKGVSKEYLSDDFFLISKMPTKAKVTTPTKSTKPTIEHPRYKNSPQESKTESPSKVEDVDSLNSSLDDLGQVDFDLISQMFSDYMSLQEQSPDDVALRLKFKK